MRWLAMVLALLATARAHADDDERKPDDQKVIAKRLFDEGREIGDATPALLRLIADIDLKEAVGAAAGLVHGLCERFDERGTVDRMDRIERGDRVFGLVRLEPADQVQPEIRPFALEIGPFALGFLDPVLAEIALAGLDQGADRVAAVGLGDGDQLDRAHTAAGERRRLGDRCAHFLEPFAGG